METAQRKTEEAPEAKAAIGSCTEIKETPKPKAEPMYTIIMARSYYLKFIDFLVFNAKK